MSVNTVEALNAISLLTVHGLITDTEGTDIPIVLHRTVPPLDLVPFLKLDEHFPPEDALGPFTPRPPSTLPERGDLHVQLILGEEKGWGRSSFVHEVARSKRRAEIAREAWFYDELECLQGVVLPRCYGWFEAELAEGQSLGPSTRATRRSSDSESSNPEWRFKKSKQLTEMSHSRSYVSVLLLEKMGGKLPIGVPLGDDLVKGIYDMYGEIAELGVDHRDIRYSNMLAAPQGPTILPSVPSPFTGRIYTHRMIDIESCEKTNGEAWLLTDWQASWVHSIVNNLPDGCIIEPWD
ncbi:hypothetical protein BS47DRAFT_580813 [Hydnum rufescens UP504]|uniref:Protein kinase domain-containing protein n=1 Tax=Hydnum rufescens UP504 TaxID=1448309 RepID=A0A9P6AG15_9AGAM|nr:hypothetical protein BS47DRAFT_580813 [Hydnum rufescens UP504]